MLKSTKYEEFLALLQPSDIKNKRQVFRGLCNFASTTCTQISARDEGILDRRWEAIGKQKRRRAHADDPWIALVMNRLSHPILSF